MCCAPLSLSLSLSSLVLSFACLVSLSCQLFVLSSFLSNMFSYLVLSYLSMPLFVFVVLDLVLVLVLVSLSLSVLVS